MSCYVNKACIKPPSIRFDDIVGNSHDGVWTGINVTRTPNFPPSTHQTGLFTGKCCCAFDVKTISVRFDMAEKKSGCWQQLWSCKVQPFYQCRRGAWRIYTIITVACHGIAAKFLRFTGSSKRKGAMFGEGSSVRADWRCIGCPELVGEGRRHFQSSNRRHFFCTSL